MKVRELMDYLSSCNPDYEVLNSYEDSVECVIERRDCTNPDNCFVLLE